MPRWQTRIPDKNCLKCGGPISRQLSNYGKRKFCGVPCLYAFKRAAYDDVVGRFWSKVEKRGPDECWGWNAQKRWDGYGRFVNRYRPIWAHRFSYELHHGKIPKDMHVLHSCDNPECTNPKHLRLGTHDENMREMLARDRGMGKLKAAQVREIRASLREPYHGINVELAQKYGVASSVISAIKRGHSYGYVK